MSSPSTRLFLDAMGLGPAWTLRTAPEQKESELAALAPAAATTDHGAAAAASMAAISAMDWTQLAAAVASCTRCELCRSRRNPVFGRGAKDAAWIVLGSGPSSADEEAGAPLSGAPGQLLGNMLQAIGLTPAEVYVTNLVKCRAHEDTQADTGATPTPHQLSACRPYLERELVLTQARTLLVLGEPAARTLLGDGLPFAALQGSVHRLGAISVIATLDPADILFKGKMNDIDEIDEMAGDKAMVWADLCIARNADAAGS